MKDLFTLLIRAHELDQELVRLHDVTLTMVCLLWALSQSEDALTTGDVGRILGRKCSTMSAILDRAEERQLIARIRSVEDRRSVHVELTPHGMDMLQQALVTINGALAPAG